MEHVARVGPSDLDVAYTVADPAFAAVLTTAHHRWFEAEARGDERFAPDPQGAAVPDLDEWGLIRVGSKVAPGTILIGRVAAVVPGAATEQDKLIRAIFGKDREDRSVRAPPGCAGVVGAAEIADG